MLFPSSFALSLVDESDLKYFIFCPIYLVFKYLFISLFNIKSGELTNLYPLLDTPTISYPSSFRTFICFQTEALVIPKPLLIAYPDT